MKHMPWVTLRLLSCFRQKHPVSLLSYWENQMHLDASTKLLNTDQTELAS